MVCPQVSGARLVNKLPATLLLTTIIKFMGSDDTHEHTHEHKMKMEWG